MKRRLTMTAVLLLVIAAALLLSACGCKHEHTFLRKKEEATCQAEGFTGERYCKDCDKVIEEGSVIPIVDHMPDEDESYDATCTEDGLIDGLSCVYCGIELRAQEIIPAIGHDIKDPVGAYEPTCTEKGFEGEGTCANCYEYIVGDEIPRIPHDFVDNVCTVCDWLVPGLYDDAMNLVMTWQEIWDADLVDYKGSSDQISWISDQLHGLLVVEEGFKVNLKPGSYTNNGTPLDNLTGIYTPYTQREFANDAFSGMSGVETVKIFGHVENIPNSMFSDAKGLEEVILPDTVKTMGFAAFKGCSIEHINLPAGLTDIGEQCFAYSSLREITLPESLSTLGKYAFSNCQSLEKVVLPRAEWIGANAFDSCEVLTDVILGSGVKFLSSGMFAYCTALTELNIPEGVCEVHYEAFKKAGIKELVFPSTMVLPCNFNEVDSPECIDLSACTQLTEIDYISGVDALTELILPPNMTKLDLAKIASNGNLKRLTLPEGLNELTGSFSSWPPVSDRFVLEEIVWPVSLKDGTRLSEIKSIKSILYCGSEAQWNETVSKDMFPDAVITFDYTGA